MNKDENKIDTLILSGGGPSGIAYIGIFKALFEKGILKRDLSGIQEIITTSVGILFSYLYMLNLTQEACEKFIMESDILSMLNYDEIHIDNLLIDYGIFSNDKIKDILKSFTKHIFHCEDISLLELYEKIPIQLTVKVFNATLSKTEYISYKTNPDLSLFTLAQMTTAIPFFFKPIQYNNNLYVDGGLKGNFPLEICKSDNYFGIFIRGGTINKDSELMKLFPILHYCYSLIKGDDIEKHTLNKKKIIDMDIKLGLNFNINHEEKKNIIQKAYLNTLKHIQSYIESS